ncbi:MAG: radical SAM protein, partial [Verrucomicrobia bacterium]|nr:radical SAM protein [Verrucomicrobiota bacterium]
MIDGSPKRSRFDLTFDGLEQALTVAGLRPAHARTFWRALYRAAPGDLRARRDFLPPLRRWIEENAHVAGGWSAALPEVAADTRSSDGLTRKFLLRLADGHAVETVLMGYPGRFTACLSTQVGCAMGCVFCATGQAGFARHLRAGEIVAQVVHAQRALRAAGDDSALRNLVLMGMGEPLHNYDAVLRALAIVTDTRGLNLGPSRITISTVGVVPGILRLAEEQRPYHLAVSLHG